MPTGQQQRDMRRFAGSCRFVFNKALAMQQALFEAGEKKLGYAGLCKELVDSKAEMPWLGDTPSQPLQQSLKDLERAYANFFEKRADCGLEFNSTTECNLISPPSRSAGDHIE